MVSSKHGKYGLRSLAVGLALGVSALVGTADIARADDGGGNQVFFRGGWAGMTSDRGNEIYTDSRSGVPVGTPLRRNDGKSGYYVGAGLDLLLSKDVWGMMSKTWALGEIGVEFKRLDSNVVNSFPTSVVGPNVTKQPITMLTVDIAPKIKFMEGSRFRPWIIPVGLDFIVISPPGEQSGYLDIGALFGAGVETQLYKAFKLGLDGRFHLASGQTNTVNNFGTVGVYVGISF